MICSGWESLVCKLLPILDNVVLRCQQLEPPSSTLRISPLRFRSQRRSLYFRRPLRCPNPNRHMYGKVTYVHFPLFPSQWCRLVQLHRATTLPRCTSQHQKQTFMTTAVCFSSSTLLHRNDCWLYNDYPEWNIPWVVAGVLYPSIIC